MIKCLKCGTENSANSAFCENCGKPLAPPGSGGGGLETLSNLQTIGGDPTLDRRAYPKDQNPTLEPGAVFADRYTIESVIGSGGMGVVYRARDKIGDRLVALKLIRSDLLGGDAAVNRLIAEGVLTQDIRHKNVVSVYHVDQLDGRPFIAMEYVNGVSLREWLRKQRSARVDVPTKVAAHIVNEVLHGLQAAHDLGVTHRDLKPENIMLTGEPTSDAAPLKLLDFGIARADGKRTDSGTSARVGTPSYMAPEQETAPESAGPSADLYSLSKIFYELLVGVLPQGHWQPPSSGRPDVPAGIDALIQSGLQNREASRPQSVAEYRQKLNAAFGGTPVPAPTPGPVTGPPNPNGGGGLKPQKPLMIGGGVVAGIVVLAVIGSSFGGGRNTVKGVKQVDVNQTEPFDPDEPVTPTPTPTPPPTPPPPPPSGYEQLSGRWLDGKGGGYSMDVESDGTFSGSGQTGQGVQVSIEGYLSGPQGSYGMSNGAELYSGRMSWDGRDCHLPYEMRAPNGAVADGGIFHINHPPGAPCPPGWGQ
ncbi:MAG TPA: serine/threonine-protein kinase [Allosphingosinicella sp.]|jgi:hypothetical protein|uniref:serine/threonine-protein kinase n=1 Tax=Allosphingosinicella sp. TaxID=2823234 RepID=UPI002F278E46